MRTPSRAHRLGRLRRRTLVAAFGLAAAAAVTAGAAPSSAVGPYPTTRTTIGTTVQGRPIYAYRIGNPAARTTAVLIGQLHGDEPAVRTAALGILTTPAAYHYVDLWIIPTANPDGAANRTRKNAHGVDLNRNFSTAWAYTEPPSSGYYQGPRAFSEPESRALAAFLGRIRPKYVIGMHQPLYGVDSENVKNRVFQQRIVARTGLPSKPFHCNGGCRGTVGQWLDATTAGSMVTVELSASVSAAAALATTRAAISAMWP